MTTAFYRVDPDDRVVDATRPVSTIKTTLGRLREVFGKPDHHPATNCHNAFHLRTKTIALRISDELPAPSAISPGAAAESLPLDGRERCGTQPDEAIEIAQSRKELGDVPLGHAAPSLPREIRK